jgi:hypothetical protein
MKYDFKPRIRKGLEAGARAYRNKGEIRSILASQIALLADNPNYSKFIVENVRLYDVGGHVSREPLTAHRRGCTFDAIVAKFVGDGPNQGSEGILAEIDDDRSGYPVAILSAGPYIRCNNASSLRRTLVNLFAAAETLETLDTLATCDPSCVTGMRRPL